MTSKMQEKKRTVSMVSDPWLMLFSLGLTLLGVVMIYSSTHQMALDKYKDSYFFLKKHLFSLTLGFIAFYLASQFPLRILRKFAVPLLLFIMGLLFLLLMPGFGVKAGGAIRWLKIGGIRVGQPSELAKIALLLYLAHTLARKQDRIHLFQVGFLPPVIVLGLVLGLLMKQPDFGTSMMLLTLTGILLFVGGVPLRFLFGSAMLALPAVYLMLIAKPYRWKRITAFLDPFHPDNIQDGAYQLVQSLKAFSSGGLWGNGLAHGQQKLGYLPEAHTDFIFAVVGEELGLIGVLFVIGAFIFLLYRGYRIALRTPDAFSRYFAVGLTSMIGLQALLNMGVVMGSLPTKGLPLPFLSFARTSLIVVFAALGLLLQIERHTLQFMLRQREKRRTTQKYPSKQSQKPSKQTQKRARKTTVRKDAYSSSDQHRAASAVDSNPSDPPKHGSDPAFDSDSPKRRKRKRINA